MTKENKIRSSSTVDVAIVLQVLIDLAQNISVIIQDLGLKLGYVSKIELL